MPESNELPPSDSATSPYGADGQPLPTTAGVPSPGGYPLAAIFLLIALVAVLMSQLGWLVASKSFDGQALLVAAIFGAGSGVVYGFFIGLYHYRLSRGLVIGAFTGLLVGALTSPVFVVAVSDPWKALSSSIGGSIVLVGLAVAYRLVNRDDAMRRSDSIAEMVESTRRKRGPGADR